MDLLGHEFSANTPTIFNNVIEGYLTICKKDDSGHVQSENVLIESVLEQQIRV